MAMRRFILKWAFAGLLVLPILPDAQVTIGGNTQPPAGVMLEVRSNDKGFLPPRLTGAEMAAIPSPPEGLIIFNTSLRSLMVFQEGSWKKIMVPAPPVPDPLPQIDSSSRCNSGIGGVVGMDDEKAIIGCGGGGLSFFRLDFQTWREEKFFPISGKVTAVAILKDFAMAGVASSNTVYCFENVPDLGWRETQRIEGPVVNNIRPVLFGFSLAMSDSFAIIGDPGYYSNRGAVHIYRKSYFPQSETRKGWILAKSELGQNGDEFGHAVDIDAQRFVVGEWLYDPGGKVIIPDVGMVYIYKRSGSGWQVESKFTHADSLRDTRLGSSLSLYNNILAVGAQNMDILTRDQSGAVCIYEMLSEGAWTLVSTLTLVHAGFEVPVLMAHFGNSVSLFENRLLIGAYTQEGDFKDEGVVYVFERKYGRWYFLKRLENPSPVLSGYFGHSVSQFGLYQVVGAPGTRSGKGEVIFFKE